ncbi:EAL domain-containing protein [uncultured Roseibium sp.]|uniref:EAL domain-containing protein n=1 Tax=uncultured Roseibium sp. TaxID=1936171 RepID=UPI002634645E|nr:EAL domain-containing protein [uncultured Roseibium sp.]
MQISHRLELDRRDHLGRVKSNTLSAFHASLLEVLPFAAAYVARDGAIVKHNGLFETACANLGERPAPKRLDALLSAESWKRCELVLSAAFGGFPAEVCGEVRLTSGEIFCSHVVCTSHIFLQEDSEAVLVQFEVERQPVPESSGVTESALVSADAPKVRKALLDKRVLEHFPDDVLIFDGTESLGDIVATLVERTGTGVDPKVIFDTLEQARNELPHTFHIPEDTGMGNARSAGGAKMSEIRLVGCPLEQDTKTSNGSFMAVIRRNVDNPHEIAENRRLAYQDPLTGLENRRAFTRALRRELERMTCEAEAGLAVYYIDLDEFKKVNDLGGHDAGDDMLLRVASCLTLTLGEFGTVARIGGDEFAAMLPVSSEETALEFAEQILEGFGRIRLEVKDRVFTISGSVGVAFIDGTAALEKKDAASLLGLADRACLRGKRIGGHSVQVHQVRPDECSCATGDQVSVPEPESFCGKELTLYAMPVVSLKNDRVCGAEVLLRLQGDRAKGMSSRAWISAAERSGFIAQVDTWTLDRVLDAAERQATRTLLTMNVSAESARDPDFRDALHNRLSVNPLLASRLCLEIAEKDLLREPSTVESFFGFVAEFGCQTAIDDFAGHWPVLSRLNGMRVEWLKLEAGLIRQVMLDPSKAKILNGLIGTVRDLGMKVIAKHIETPGEAELLKTLDIDAAQGFHFGRPAPWPEI